MKYQQIGTQAGDRKHQLQSMKHKKGNMDMKSNDKYSESDT